MKVWVLLCLLLGSVALAQPPLDQARLYTVQSTIANGQGMASVRLDPQNTLPGTVRDYSAPLSGGSLSHPVSLFPGDNRILIEYGNFSKEVTAKLEVKAPEVRVELRWAGKNQDYDLYVKSVNYQNTDAEGGKLDQDWISEDHDDSDPGVENITFAEAEAGIYNISVNYYHDNEDGNNDGQPDGSPQGTTVNVFVDGISVYTATRTISKYDYGASFWGVGTLVIHSGEETGGYMVNPSTGLRDMLPQKAFLDKIAPRGDFEIDEIRGPNGTDDVYLLVGQSAQFELTGTVNVGTENEEGAAKIIGDFEVSDTALAIVDETGVVTGIAPGTVEVRSVSDNSKKLTVHLLPVEVAPEVLKVNADFDEGRLDPTTGYAIPDCYDIGNSLKAEMDHLDGTYAKDEVITDDLHKGWFGVNPQLMNDDFWDGATVTISKIAKPNTTYGGDQEGNVRFYATWEDAGNGGETAYQAIDHFDATSLTPINLVGSVYGSLATIPANTEFWIEGIRGGQITLEWKYKKGDVELLFEQEFLVATEQSKQDWIDEIVYEIRLQSSDDIGGEVDITTFATSGLPSFAANKEQLFEMYDYYPELFLQTYGVDAADLDEVMAWYGLARCTTAEIVGGLAVMEDVYIKAPTAAAVTSSFSSPTLGPFLGYLSAHSRSTIREIQQALYLGAWDIFEDLAWQGRAYRASGIYAMDAVRKKGTAFRFDAWVEIDTGRRLGNVADIRSGVQKLADREQNIVVQPAFTVVQGISVYPSWPVSVNADDVFSLLAENPVPGGISFGDWRGWSLLKNVAVAADRWDWATYAPDGIIPQWYTKTPAQHEALDLEHIEVRGRNFHARKYWPGEEPLLESEWQNDRPSRPHIIRY